MPDLNHGSLKAPSSRPSKPTFYHNTTVTGRSCDPRDARSIDAINYLVVEELVFPRLRQLGPAKRSMQPHTTRPRFDKRESSIVAFGDATLRKRAVPRNPQVIRTRQRTPTGELVYRQTQHVPSVPARTGKNRGDMHECAVVDLRGNFPVACHHVHDERGFEHDRDVSR